jgi:anti-sigma-K factor RskA
MADELNREEVRALLGAYALGALSDDEPAQVETLVLADHDARAELHALQLGASWLDSANRPPARHVWDKIAREIGHESPGLVSITRSRQRRRLPRVLAGAAAVIAAIGIGAGVVALVGDAKTRVPVEQAARTAAANPSSTEVSLATASGEPRVDAVVTRDGHGYLLDSSLPELSRDETYQLWAITPSGPASAAVLGRNPGVHEFRIPSDTTRLAITNEPEGGSDRPTGLVTASAELS